MKEIDLAEHVVSWLKENGHEVYQEVQFFYGSAVADIVTFLDGHLWIIETKIGYGIPVLDQAYQWRVPYRSVAVKGTRGPRPASWREVALDFYEVGIIEVMDYGWVEEIESPPFKEKFTLWGKEMEKKLTGLHKTFAPAGSQGGAHLTPYKETMIRVKQFITNNPGSTAREIVAGIGETHYNGSGSDSLRNALVKFESWCYTDKSQTPFKFYLLDDNIRIAINQKEETNGEKK